MYVRIFNDRKGVEPNTKTLVAKQLGTVALQVPFSMEPSVEPNKCWAYQRLDIYIRIYSSHIYTIVLRQPGSQHSHDMPVLQQT